VTKVGKAVYIMQGATTWIYWQNPMTTIIATKYKKTMNISNYVDKKRLLLKCGKVGRQGINFNLQRSWCHQVQRMVALSCDTTPMSTYNTDIQL